jgi:hypothetical protein
MTKSPVKEAGSWVSAKRGAVRRMTGRRSFFKIVGGASK